MAVKNLKSIQFLRKQLLLTFKLDVFVTQTISIHKFVTRDNIIMELSLKL